MKNRFKKNDQVEVLIRSNWYKAVFVKYGPYKGQSQIIINGKQITSCTEYLRLSPPVDKN